MDTTTVALLGGAVVLVGAVAVASLRLRGSSGGSPRLGSAQRSSTRSSDPTDRTSRSDTEPATRRESTRQREESTSNEGNRQRAGLAADVEKQLSSSETGSTTTTTSTTATTSAGSAAAASSADTPATEETGSLDDLWTESTASDDEDLTAATEDLLDSTGDLDDDWSTDDDESVDADETLFESSDAPSSDYRASQPARTGEPDDDLDSLF